MKALILAAGFGTRMVPITETIPKPLIPVVNVPVIEYNIHLLKYHGIKEIFINLHHNGSKISKVLGTGKKYGVKIRYLHEEEILGTGGAIGSLKGLVEEPFVVINSDTIFDFDFDEMVNSHFCSGRKVTLGVIPSSSKDSRAVLTVDEKNVVVRMLESSIYTTVPEGNAIFTGIHIIDPSVLEYIPDDVFVSITNYVYQRMVEGGDSINAFIINGKWWDMGTPDDYIECSFELLKLLPFKYFDPFEKYKLKPDVYDNSSLVIMGDQVKMHAIPLVPPLILGNGVDLNNLEQAGPNLIAGDKVKLKEKNDSANVIYFSNSDGSRVLFGKKGKIFY
ncbi:MAG TPA: nucleotidyltransferase family protein [bacterium]|nr:nucleotidyltransferase family protein [bacterium]